MDGGVEVDDDGGEGGADLDGHQDMKLEGLASALEEGRHAIKLFKKRHQYHTIHHTSAHLPITNHKRGHKS